ncbi:hypothetical protein D1872_215250 [compost metagenome]
MSNNPKWRYIFYAVLMLTALTGVLKYWNEEGPNKFLCLVGVAACLIGLYRTWKEGR